MAMNTQNAYLKTNAGSIGLALALKLEGLGFKATLTLQKSVNSIGNTLNIL